jgi:co-chaperonin GroES (HSP10)
MVDVKKIQRGDTVTVKGTVISINNHGDVGIKADGNIIFVVSTLSLATHTPKPVEIKEGDSVQWRSYKGTVIGVRTVLDQRLAWVSWGGAYAGNPTSVIPLAELVLDTQRDTYVPISTVSHAF